MPELPEVEITRCGIAPHLKGRRVRGVIVRQRQLRWPVPHSLNELRGVVIHSVSRRAKYILLGSESGTAILHLGMSGSLRVVDEDAQVRRHDHLDLLLDGERRLRLHDPRRFGAVLWTRQDPLQHPLLAALGPEPLGTAFDGDRLFSLSRKRRIAVKNFIMTAAIVVGVGNIYASEALFRAGIRPSTAAGRISRARYDRLAAAIRTVLADAIQAGGTTLRDFLNPQGEPGYFQRSLYVYGRSGQPCHHCQTPIRHQLIGQRASCYCPRCQSAS